MNQEQPRERPANPSWSFDPEVPTYDFFEGRPLSDPWSLQEAVESFIYNLEEDRFLTWEAVACHEQGLPLTVEQQEAVDSLIDFGDEEDDRILYINDIPRTSEPWHAILNKIVSHLLIEPYRTSDLHEEVKCDGWKRLMAALEEHGSGLSLPPGAASFAEVVPANLRHRLWLQYCFDILGGLGQSEDLTLEEHDPWRVDDLVLRLQKCRESVSYAGLTLESCLKMVILPERDRPVFIKLMKEKLGLTSTDEPLARRLPAAE